MAPVLTSSNPVVFSGTGVSESDVLTLSDPLAINKSRTAIQHGEKDPVNNSAKLLLFVPID